MEKMKEDMNTHTPYIWYTLVFLEKNTHAWYVEKKIIIAVK